MSEDSDTHCFPFVLPLNYKHGVLHPRSRSRLTVLLPQGQEHGLSVQARTGHRFDYQQRRRAFPPERSASHKCYIQKVSHLKQSKQKTNCKLTTTRTVPLARRAEGVGGSQPPALSRAHCPHGRLPWLQGDCPWRALSTLPFKPRPQAEPIRIYAPPKQPEDSDTCPCFS